MQGKNGMKNDNTIYIATISGGKDSVTMCDLLLKNGHQVDMIVFNDTLQEFDEMYEYIIKVGEYFKTRYNKTITWVQPKNTFEDWCFGTLSRGEKKGIVRGIPNITTPCYWRREAKVNPFNDFIKDFKNVVVYIGYTKEENRSVQDTDKVKYVYPLKELGMTEEDCKRYMIEQEMENPLYRHFSRTGCRMCPYQSEQSFYNIWKHYPKVWQYMKDIESKLDGSMNDRWFVGNKTCADMEKIFIQADQQGSLFDFSDEPLKDCFCKI